VLVSRNNELSDQQLGATLGNFPFAQL